MCRWFLSETRRILQPYLTPKVKNPIPQIAGQPKKQPILTIAILDSFLGKTGIVWTLPYVLASASTYHGEGQTAATVLLDSV